MKLKSGLLIMALAFAVAVSPKTAFAADASGEITSLPCKAGEVQTYRYSSVFAGKTALDGTEAWTTTSCGDRIVFKPGGKLFKQEIVLDKQGTLYQGPSIFTGEAVEYPKGLPLLRLPLAPGKSWNADIVVKGDSFHDSGTQTYHVIAWEKVKVPAGEYNALKMTTSYSMSGSTSRGDAYHGVYEETLWYAPETRAVVKEVASDTFGNKATREMISVGQ
jgi:hypothetical protein